MNTRFPFRPVVSGLSACALLVAVWPGELVAQPPDPPPVPADVPGVEVQARGPVHEAFAEPTTAQPVPGPVVAKQPPDPIEELPPDQKPEGDNVQWIPGYWSWDDEATEFLWVSGCWREVPPGRRWVPGHWQEVDGGWVWVAGFWGAENLTEVQYLPSPPPTLDQGPSAPAPDDNSVYVPGCWVYQTSKYLWRPGHWIAYQANWVWIPAYYVWTPSGCIFVDGHWDHPLDQRGLLFAPVRIDLRAFGAARRAFVPDAVVSTDFLLGALFVRPTSRHYYFGDYFDPRYDKLGYVAWPDFHPVKGAFDPTFAYYRRLHGADAKWEPALRTLYSGRRGGEIPRPPRTLAKQVEALRAVAANRTAETAIHKSVALTHAQNVTVLAPLRTVATGRVTNLAAIGGGREVVKARELKLEAVNKEALVREQKAAEVMRAVGQQRREEEAKALGAGRGPVAHTDPVHAIKLDLPRPPAAVGPAREPLKRVPEPIVVPKHEERPIPKYEPPKPYAPPRPRK
jgi:hypothetical protein